jgi:hypothetical protein
VLPELQTKGDAFTLGVLVSDVDAENGEKHELALAPGGLSSGGVKVAFGMPLHGDYLIDPNFRIRR